jgi:hypothetical protein
VLDGVFGEDGDGEFESCEPLRARLTREPLLYRFPKADVHGPTELLLTPLELLAGPLEVRPAGHRREAWVAFIATATTRFWLGTPGRGLTWWPSVGPTACPSRHLPE